VWIDADGDGHYSSPAASAERALRRLGGNADEAPEVEALVDLLSSCDSAVAIQLLVQAQQLWGDRYPDAVGRIPALVPRHQELLQSLLERP
jgi:hypothetical protein